MAILGIDEPAAIKLLSTKRRQSLRVNTLKVSPEAFEGMGLSWVGAPFSWMEGGYRLERSVEKVRDNPLIVSGKVFIQNAASWLPVLALNLSPQDKILDVCAAPGGKTSHMAALTNNEARIWANDNSRVRLAKLRANMERLGAVIENYTLYDATRLGQKLESERFDKILLDAPCSGEGLMEFGRDKDFETWSVAHIKRLQQLQKRLITQAWQLLEPGGTLVYSTCTMAPEENEAVIDYLLRTHPDAHIESISIDLPNRVPTVQAWNDRTYNPAVAQAIRLVPSEEIEAFFVCKVHKKQYRNHPNIDNTRYNEQ